MKWSRKYILIFIIATIIGLALAAGFMIWLLHSPYYHPWINL